ncbi:hypothetical protein [Slackia piriformis]|nr:hypothetical protein [Slackia piriformis]
MAEETEKTAVEDGSKPGKALSKVKALPMRQKVAIGLGCALVVAGVGVGVAVAAQQQRPAAEPAAVEQAGPAKEALASITAEAEGWDFATSTPLIAHVAGDGADFYVSLGEGGSAELSLALGEYEVDFVPSIGADGSLLKHEGELDLHVSDEGGSVSAEFVKVEAEDVSEDEMKAAVEAVAKAVEGGDGSLKGEAGKAVLETAKSNAAANPNMSEEAKEESEKVADGAEAGLAADDASSQAGAAQDAGSSTGQSGQDVQSGGNASSSTASSSSGTSSASSSSKPAHQHSWAAVTTQQWVSNPVSVWVQDSAAWDEPVYSGTYWCNKCGCAVDATHNKDMMMQGQGGHSLTVKQVQTGTIHHEATGHYETQDQGWYETVTTGYQCSGCGAWQ